GFEIRDMARHFPSLTAQMAALGERGVPAVADLSAALQVAMHTAGNADEAGNNITNLLAKINAPGTIKKFEQNFGIDLPRAMKKLTDEGYSTLEAIALITDRATGGDDKKLGFAFEDRQAQMGILALIQNLEEFRDIRAQAMDSQGTVDGAFDQRMSRDQMVQLRQLGVAFANLVLSAAPVLLPFLRKVTTMMTAGVTAITGWARAHPQAASMLLKLFAAVAIGKVALGGLQIAFGGLLGPMSAAYRYFAKVDGISRFGAHLARFKGIAGTTATVGVKAFGLLRSGAMFLARGLVRAGMMMLANPMVLLIAGIVVAVGLLAYAVYSNWDKIRAGFSAGWAYVTDLLSGAANWMGSIGRQMMNGLLSAIDPMALGGRLVNMARNGITQFKNYLGIKSPSRVFMEMGGHVAGGLALGIDRRGPTAMASARRLAAGVAGAAALGTGAPLAAGGGGSMGGVGGAPVYQITVNVPAGAEADSIAAAVRREVEAIERRRAAVDRSRFGDG
ncbi:MAG: hypothetical protein KKE77_13420, partial [Alphaproteobacteria bacterium]|nr:hypothetical protein [Alphaproteobacteria bacterium]